MYNYNRISAKTDSQVQEEFTKVHEDMKTLYQEILSMESMIEEFESRIEAVPDKAPSADYRRDIQNAKKSVLKALKDAKIALTNRTMDGLIMLRERSGHISKGL
jgi:hypothetical protein